MKANLNEASFREQRRYSFREFQTAFDSPLDGERAKGLIRRLKARQILKQDRKKEEKDLSELVEEDISEESTEEEGYFVFAFVGIIWVDGCLVKCYPKYCDSPSFDANELTTVFQVLRKYDRKSDKELIRLHDDGAEETSFNLLSVALFFLVDYHENGLYANEKQVVETNGAGDILWERTIGDSFAVLQDGAPFYMELRTRRRVLDEGDYFRRLHQCILGICSRELQARGILELFGLTAAEETAEELADFGDERYVCHRIEGELNVQFNTRKRLLLNTMYAFVKNLPSARSDDHFGLYGTNAFHAVWEDVCQEILQNRLDTPRERLPKEIGEVIKPAKSLKEYIEKPKWIVDDRSTEADTFIPDLISLDESKKIFSIFDAKYYHVQTTSGKIVGQPGIESVAKQYLYELAYREIPPEWTRRNAFLFPVQGSEKIFERKGEVEMKMFCDEPLRLKSIQIVFVNPRKAYEKYLRGESALGDVERVF